MEAKFGLKIEVILAISSHKIAEAIKQGHEKEGRTESFLESKE